MEKKLKVITGITSRDLVKTVNELGIQLEDVVSIIYRDAQFILFYYG